MDSIEQERGIELSRVSCFAHSSATAIHELDTIDGVAVSATTNDGNKQYEFLTGFRMWSLIIAIMLSMLLLGLDINIVATVSVLSFFHDSVLLLTNVPSGHSHYIQCIPQYRGY